MSYTDWEFVNHDVTSNVRATSSTGTGYRSSSSASYDYNKYDSLDLKFGYQDIGNQGIYVAYFLIILLLVKKLFTK